MDREKDQQGNPWPVLRADSVDDLRRLIDEREEQAKTGECLAWRGHGRSEWQLESTLDRWLQTVSPDGSYEQWLGREQALLCRFRTEARVYASETESQQLSNNWTALAFGRHAGLPTRLLDWTQSPWVAAWFACHEDSDADGAIWWFNQQQLECIIHKLWDEWGVPTRAVHQGFPNMSETDAARLDLDQRALEATAFNPNGHPWISKLHYPFPCSRMEAQQGFATVCGRLRITHNKAIDKLTGSKELTRGRIVISSRIKGEVLKRLKTMNIHAASLKYPGVDIVAQKINADGSSS